MNVTNSVFQKVGDIFLVSKKRRDAEYADFLEFFRTLVEETDSAVASAVGHIDVMVVQGKEEKQWGVLLTVADYIFWKQHITEDGVRFKKSIDQVKSDILRRLAKKAEDNNLTADERKSLITLLDQ